MSARLLVVGASGLVGAELARRARAAGHVVLGVARTARGEATRALDLGDRAGLEAVLADFRPTTVIVASAYPHVDGCEAHPARGERENVRTIETLVGALRGNETRLLFFSTDHVFDGNSPRYVERDAVNPLYVYARQKRAAEERVLAHPGALVVRTSWVFGAERARKNFVYRVVDAVEAGRPLVVPEGQGGSPTWSGWLAGSTLTLLARGVEGVVHLTGGTSLTKAEWARRVARDLDLAAPEIREVPWRDAGQIASRPARVVLATERHDLVQPDLTSILRAERERILASRREA
jgi:dTDP-4-dehydrorhamnose reductase